MSYKKKLIEVALPLAAINAASAREKSIRHGHPSTLHLWWARRPLATARAVIWASLVDDPSALPEEFPTEADQARERRRLFGILEELVVWENSDDVDVLRRARREIEKSTDGNPPPILDPFCGGGTIPLEAQRLGLKALGGDLNPVAVLISKAVVEIPPRFADLPPIHPPDNGKHPELQSWKGAQGLAEDIRYYGEWVRERALEKIGHLYPKGPNGETVIAWLWARTVKCPNPACGAEMPLVRSFKLGRKSGRRAWVEPLIDRSVSPPTVSFDVRTEPEDMFHEVPVGTVNRRGGRCAICDGTVPFSHIRREGRSGRMRSRPLAVVVEGTGGRAYHPASPEDATGSNDGRDCWAPDIRLPENPRDFKTPKYGMETFGDIFTSRQLMALTTFSDLAQEVWEQAAEDAKAAGMADDGVRLRDGGNCVAAYADALITYMAITVNKCGDYWSSICTWHSGREIIRNTFARQAIPMTWDYAETNPFSDSTGNWMAMVEWVAKSVARLPAHGESEVVQREAKARIAESTGAVISTDPPYYDNISYAELSDFFYVWLRRCLADVWPDEFSTLTTPKADELIAAPYRHGSQNAAKEHFENAMASVLEGIATSAGNGYPTTIFYAYKQTEKTAAGRVSTGWQTFLDGLLAAGLSISATWPVRTEMTNRTIARGTNALASSIVIVCRPRPANAPLATRSEFLQALRSKLPMAIELLEKEDIPPIDMEQAVIGPGMKIFSAYAKVIEADGSNMSVGDALALISEVRQELLSEHEAELDRFTRWALVWFEQHGMDPGPYGDAEQLSKSKNTSVDGVVRAGIATSGAGQVQLIDRRELSAEWDPVADKELTVWEATQHLLARLETGEAEAAALLRQLGGAYGERAATLARILYDICNRKGWMQEGVAYNGLRVAWPQLERLAAQVAEPTLPGLGE